MSDNWITIIPRDPTFIPGPANQASAEERVRSFAPDAEKIEVIVSNKISFHDCGCNFERILCPSCRTEIAVEWWQQRMDDDYDHDHGFKLSTYRVPCCQASCTLNDLIYEWPQGFASFAIDAMNPRIGKFTEAQIRELERTLGTSLRIIYQHL